MKRLWMILSCLCLLAIGATAIMADHYGQMWEINDYLTFTCQTHDAGTGVVTDAAVVPDYNVYEDETGTAIVASSMTKLDDAGSTGFYSERIQLTTALGYELGKCYTIHIEYTVDSNAMAQTHNFRLTDIAGSSDFQTAAAAALTSYDPPTQAQVDANFAALNDLSTSDNIGINWGDITNPTSEVALTGTTLDLISDAVDGIVSQTFADSNWTTANTNINDIETDSNELQTDWANGGRLDLILDAVGSAAIATGAVATSGGDTASSFTLTTAFPATADAYPEGTVIAVTDATDSKVYLGMIEGYTAGRIVTLCSDLAITPADADVVNIYAAVFQPPKFQR